MKKNVVSYGQSGNLHKYKKTEITKNAILKNDGHQGKYSDNQVNRQNELRTGELVLSNVLNFFKTIVFRVEKSSESKKVSGSRS